MRMRIGEDCVDGKMNEPEESLIQDSLYIWCL